MQKEDGGVEVISAVVIYVFRSQLHCKRSSGNKYVSMQSRSTTLISFKMQAQQCLDSYEAEKEPK